jgi:hypothetical protein
VTILPGMMLICMSMMVGSNATNCISGLEQPMGRTLSRQRPGAGDPSRERQQHRIQRQLSPTRDHTESPDVCPEAISAGPVMTAQS